MDGGSAAGVDVFNLWPTEVVPGEDLVGRAGVIGEIERELTGGRSVLLAAPRREGKSSVAREVLRRLAEDDIYLTASLDFFRLTTKRQCADELVRQLLESSKTLASRLHRLLGAAGERMSGFEPHLKLAELEFGVRLNPREVDEDEAFRNALQLPERLAGKEDRRVVVLLDEFQDAGKNLGQDVYRVMRSYF
ncbi:MAG TPA: ATP-binding protein, partial [Chloroflexota bacterium]|nr:ATP-binding protein [Chloroflexota bacterium]